MVVELSWNEQTPEINQANEEGGKMKCSKLIGLVVGIILVAGMSFADVMSDWLAAKALRENGDDADAQAAYEKIVLDYPGHILLPGAQYNIGVLLRRQMKYAEAVVAFDVATTNYPTAHESLLGNIQLVKGFALKDLGKHAEANTAYVNAIGLFVRVPAVSQERLLAILGYIKPSEMSAATYTLMLKDIIKATPATEAYTLFLGRVKSEIEKMK